MTIKPILFSVAVVVGLNTVGQINNPDAQGYIERGNAMLRDKNYTGVSQQMKQLSELHPSFTQSEEARRLAALAALHLPGHPEALELLTGWLADYPGSPYYPEMTAAKGDYYFTEGDYSKALDIYNSISEGSLNQRIAADVKYRKAYSMMMLGEVQAAANLFSELTTDKQWRGAAYFYSGYLAYSEGDYNTALQYFNRVPANSELNDAAEYYKTQIYFSQGNYAQSLENAKSLLKKNTYSEFYGETARIAGESLFNLGREEEALPYLRMYVSSTDTPLPSACYILGVGEYKEGNYQAAVDNLSKAANQDNAMGQSANLFLGQSYVGLGRHDSALMSFEKAYRMKYDREVSESALYNYAVAKSEGGRVPFGNSVALFEDFLKQYPDSRYASSVQEYIISGYMTDNDYERALRVIETMRNPSPETIAAKQRCLFVLGTREYSSGNISSALSRFRQAAAIRGGDAGIGRQSLIWEGTCEYDLGRYDDAAKSFLSYIQGSSQRDENLALARYDLGYTRFAQHDYKSALTDFRYVIDLKPETQMLADAYNRAGDCLYYQSDFSGAEGYYKKAYETNPSAGDYALFQQAVMKGLKRDHKGKIEGLDDMMERYPASGLVPAAILEKAESYAATGNNSEAISTYRRLLKDYPATSYGRKGALQLAITYQSIGNTNDAIEAYKYVISTYPTGEEAKLAADDLKRIYADRGRLREYQQFIKSVPDAPQTDPSEMDALAFRAAEADYVNNERIAQLQAYIEDYPSGVYLPQALFLLAQAAENGGDDEEVLRLTTLLTANYPDADVTSDALIIKAEAELTLGKGQDALDTYRLLEEKAAGTRSLQQARLGIMRTASGLNRYDIALDAAEKLMSSSGTDLNEQKEVAYNHALSLYNTGRKTEAMTEWELLAREPQNLYGSSAAVRLAEAQLEAGRIEDARKTADNLINSNPPHQYWLARGFIVLSDALRAQGESFEADEYLRSLKANYPGDEIEIFEMIDSRLKQSN